MKKPDIELTGITKYYTVDFGLGKRSYTVVEMHTMLNDSYDYEVTDTNGVNIVGGLRERLINAVVDYSMKKKRSSK